MATIQAIAFRRANVLNRLEVAKTALQDGQHFAGVEEQPITNRDAGLAEVQRLENLAVWLEASVKTLDEINNPIAVEDQSEIDEDENQASGEDESIDEHRPDDSTSDNEQGESLFAVLVGIHASIIDALIAKGYPTTAHIREASNEDLKVPGAGPATIAKIRELTAA